MRWGAGQASPPCSDSSCVRGAALLAGDPRSQPQCEGALRSSLIKGPLTLLMHRLFELGTGVTWPNQDWKERQEKLMIRCGLGPLNAELLHFPSYMQQLLPQYLYIRGRHGRSWPDDPWHAMLSSSGRPDCVRALLRIEHTLQGPGKDIPWAGDL